MHKLYIYVSDCLRFHFRNYYYYLISFFVNCFTHALRLLGWGINNSLILVLMNCFTFIRVHCFTWSGLRFHFFPGYIYITYGCCYGFALKINIKFIFGFRELIYVHMHGLFYLDGRLCLLLS